MHVSRVRTPGPSSLGAAARAAARGLLATLALAAAACGSTRTDADREGSGAAEASRGRPREGGPGVGGPAAAAPVLAGTVTGPAGEPLRAALVTARNAARGVAVTVFSDAAGAYAFERLQPGTYRIEALGVGVGAVTRDSVALPAAGSSLDLRLIASAAPEAVLPSSSRLTLLPEGETKRRFLLDCTGCHQLADRFASVEGRARSREEWAHAVELMLSFAGPASGFPIIAPGREPGPTADWLVTHLGEPGAPPRPLPTPPPPPDEALRAIVTEYDLPDAADLPHDLMLDPEGRVVVTGMFRGVMYRLDPATGEFEEIAIPVPQANPRALEIEPDGTWWVLLGGPEMIARRDPASGAWTQHAIGAYAHSLAPAADGRIWFNAHFSKDPAWIASLDRSTGNVRRHEIPSATRPLAGSPIPYEMRTAPDGSLWGTELVGNRVFRFSPETGDFDLHELPTPHAGPRRLDVAPDGTVWIPEYAANRLARLDPRTGEITEHELPTLDALPYVARVDARTGKVWVAEAGADALALFDPHGETFVEVPLPSPALVRHLDVDPRTGAVWAASSSAPPIAPKVIRLELPAARR